MAFLLPACPLTITDRSSTMRLRETEMLTNQTFANPTRLTYSHSYMILNTGMNYVQLKSWRRTWRQKRGHGHAQRLCGRAWALLSEPRTSARVKATRAMELRGIGSGPARHLIVHLFFHNGMHARSLKWQTWPLADVGQRCNVQRCVGGWVWEFACLESEKADFGDEIGRNSPTNPFWPHWKNGKKRHPKMALKTVFGPFLGAIFSL